MTTTESSMIEAHELTKIFDRFQAVEDVTIDVEAGSVFALLGPNGAGKTTTVRMLTSILKPTSGSARVAGYDVVRQPAEVRASVGVLTEQHGLYERMRAMDYLDFFGQVYAIPPAERRKRGLALMARFGLEDALGRRLGEYSKGMKQKLALVRSMLHDPKVLLLDEPTSAMDPQSAKQVRDAITELRRDRRTVVLTTHNLAEAQMLADRIAVVRRGRIIANGTFDELRQRFLGDPIMQVKLSAPLNGAAASLADLITIEEQGNDWFRYRTPNENSVNPAVLRRLTEHNHDVITLSEVPQSLEDVYLEIVAEDEKAHDSPAQTNVPAGSASAATRSR